MHYFDNTNWKLIVAYATGIMARTSWVQSPKSQPMLSSWAKPLTFNCLYWIDHNGYSLWTKAPTKCHKCKFLIPFSITWIKWPLHSVGIWTEKQMYYFTCTWWNNRAPQSRPGVGAENFLAYSKLHSLSRPEKPRHLQRHYKYNQVVVSLAWPKSVQCKTLKHKRQVCADVNAARIKKKAKREWEKEKKYQGQSFF